MTERWERVVKTLADVDAPDSVRARYEEGPRGGGDTPSARRRVSAAIVAFAVFAAAGVFTWRAFERTDPSVDRPPVDAVVPLSEAALLDDVPPRSFSGQTIAAGPLSQSEFHDRPVIVVAWASWCEPCRQTLADVQFMTQRNMLYPAAVGAVPPEDVENARLVARDLGLSFPSIAVEVGDSEIQALPAVWVLTQQGEVVATHLGSVDKTWLSAAIYEATFGHPFSPSVIPAADAPCSISTVINIAGNGSRFDTDCLAISAERATPFEFRREGQGLAQSFVICAQPDCHSEESIVGTEIVLGPSVSTGVVPALDAGTYYFVDEVHPTTAKGTLYVVEPGESPEVGNLTGLALVEALGLESVDVDTNGVYGPCHGSIVELDDLGYCIPLSIAGSEVDQWRIAQQVRGTVPTDADLAAFIAREAWFEARRDGSDAKEVERLREAYLAAVDAAS